MKWFDDQPAPELMTYEFGAPPSAATAPFDFGSNALPLQPFRFDDRAAVTETEEDLPNCLSRPLQPAETAVEPVDELAPARPSAPVTPASFDEALEEAREHGFKRGLEVGLSQVEARQASLEDEVTRRWEETLFQLNQLGLMVREQVWRTSLSLSEALARRIISRELSVDSLALFATAEQTVKNAVGLGPLTLYLNPEAVERLAPQTEALLGLHPDGLPIKLMADPTLGLGSCRVVTAEGEIENLLVDRIRRLLERIDSEMGVDLDWLDLDFQPGEVP